MAVINTNSSRGPVDPEKPTVIPTDTYHMKIEEAAYEENRFETNKDGSPRMQVTVTWKVSRITEDQEEAGVEVGFPVWQRFNPYYGTVKQGGASRFKAFIDGLREQGHLADFSPDAFDTDDLVGIEQRVAIECYTKSMGENAGQLGNKVTSVMPLKPRRVAPAAPRASAPVTKAPARNVPEPIEQEETDPFAVNA